MRRLLLLPLLISLLLLPTACDDDDSTGPGGGEADARVFFAERPQDCSISRIRYLDVGQEDAVNVTTLNGPDSVTDLAIDGEAGLVYYTFGGSSANDTDTVRRIRVDGTDPEILATYGITDLTPRGVAVDTANDALYWLAVNGCSPCPDCGDCSQLVQSDLDGSVVNPLEIISGDRNPGRVAVNPATGRAYWSDLQFPPHIESIVTDGTGLVGIYTRNLGEGGGVRDLEIDSEAGMIYWLENDGIGDASAIKRATLDGSAAETILNVGGSRASTPRGLALDLAAGKIYWTESGFCDDTETGRIRRANLDGSGAETVLDGLGVLTAVEVAR